jgi:uncharacterized protein (DUF2267 family)
MDELVKKISEKVGITEAQAQQAVDMVLSVLKERLPAPVASQVEAVLKGDVSDLGDVLGGVGGLFGKK